MLRVLDSGGAACFDVTEAVYKRFFNGVVEDILAFAAGDPIRML